jgi:hypothetical protein
VLGPASIVTSRRFDEIRGRNEIRRFDEIRGRNEIRGVDEIRGLDEIRRVAGAAGMPDRRGCRRSVGLRGPNGGDCPNGGPAAGVRRGRVTGPLPGTD